MAQLTEEEASALIAAKVEAARELISEAEALATEHKLTFSWDLSYGMGGWFESGEWQASSQSC
jgi:hypothetical protein